MNERLIKFLIVLSIFVGYTFYKVVQFWPQKKILAAAITALIFLIMLGANFAYRSNEAIFEDTWFVIASWLGVLLVGVWATFIFLSIPFDLLQLVVFIFDRLTGNNTDINLERRVFLFKSINTSLIALSTGLVGLGFLEMLRGPKIKEAKVKIKNLPASLQGLRIAQISDLHIGPTIRRSYVEDVVAKTNSLNADIVVLTGDIVDGHAEFIGTHIQPLGDLKSRHGVYYVTGNHEYYWGAPSFISKVKELGFTPLINENVSVEIGDSKILMAGVTDPAGAMLEGHTPNLEKASISKEETEFKILLAHRPDTVIEAEKFGFNLQFSGHTHAGQFFPFSLMIGLFHKYTRGLYQHEKMWLYVNPGTGYWGPATRLGVMSEVTLVVLENEA